MKHVISYFFVAVTFFFFIVITKGENYGLTAPRKVFNELARSGEAGSKAFQCNGQSGSFCTDEQCGSITVCVPGNPQQDVNCPNGQTCNKGKCSFIPTPFCEYEGLNFKCNSEGVFPEPSNCKKFNYCVPPVTLDGPAISGDCPPGFSYNIVNTLCDKKLPANMMCADTNRAVPSCTTLRQNGALKGSASYYYVCLPHSNSDSRLYPNIYRCPGNQKYKGNFVCK